MPSSNYFFKSKISDNILETPQGYLICKNVPIARVGYQEYLGSEIGIDTNKIVDVKRSSNEVFDKKAMASFENLPFTDEHPKEEVTIENWGKYTKGFVNNIRRGEGKDRNLLIADITVYDAEIIDKILDGKREISCGYSCLYEINENGEYEQTKIRGNHIALVENGRAGELVAIRDSKSKKQEEKMKKNNKKQFNLFKMWIKDQEPEIIEEIKEELEEALDEEKEEMITSDEELKEKMMELLTDSDMLERLAEKIAEIKQGDSDEIEEAEEVLEELESAMSDEEVEDEEEVSDEEMTDEEEVEDEEEKPTSDAIKFARKQLKNIAKIKDNKIRKQQVKLIMQDINTIMKKNKRKSKNVYSKLNNAKSTKDGNIDLVTKLRNKTSEMKNMRRGIK